MNAQQPTIVRTRPIEAVIISIDEKYVQRIAQYLEKLQCRMTQKAGEYQIAFPEGTIEVTPAGQSTQWAHRTIIKLPSGKTFNRTIFAPIKTGERSRETLYFPVEILELPEA